MTEAAADGGAPPSPPVGGGTSPSPPVDGGTSPSPPDTGWTLEEAADVLLMELAKRVWTSANPTALFGSLAVDLQRVLWARADLCLTGYDDSRPIGTQRITVLCDRYRSAAFFHLFIEDGRMRIRRPGQEHYDYLSGVRVENAPSMPVCGRSSMPPAETPPAAPGPDGERLFRSLVELNRDAAFTLLEKERLRCGLSQKRARELCTDVRGRQKSGPRNGSKNDRATKVLRFPPDW